MTSAATAFDLPSLADLGFTAVLNFEDEAVERSTASAVPVDAWWGAAWLSAQVMMHGMGDFGQNPMGMVPLRKLIASTANAYVTSVELCSEESKLSGCDSEDQKNGFFMTMDKFLRFIYVYIIYMRLSCSVLVLGFSLEACVTRTIKDATQ